MKFEQLSQKLKVVREDFGKVGSIAGVTLVLPMVGSLVLLTTAYQFGPWLQDNREIGVLVFVAAMSLLSGLALLATNVLGIVSGFAFDFYAGMFAQIVGIAGAATIMFFLARRFASGKLLSVIGEKPKIKAIHNALLNENAIKTLFIITLLRLSPAMPFAATNFLISASGISFKTFIAGTVLGMAPRASAVVFVGSSLTELNFSQPQESWVIFLGIAATALSVIVVGVVSKRALDRLTLQHADLEAE